MKSFEIIVHFGTNVIELGECDVDHISIIPLLHVVTEIHTGNSNSPTDDYVVYVQLPWCNERLEIRNDKEIIEVFDLFSKYYCKRIVFEPIGIY
ncbi:hypothetical protein ACOSQ3_005028 [Xanthoceras sorbifolium]